MPAEMWSLVENALNWRTHLVIGGARSGKTAYGMRLAVECDLDQWMIATAEAGDAEMRERIRVIRLSAAQFGKWLRSLLARRRLGQNNRS